MKKLELFGLLENYICTLENDFQHIPQERREALNSLGNYIKQKINAGETAKLTVICTHNSRRSQFGQVWLAVAAPYFGLKLESFSGGTEATALHPNAVAALCRTGLDIQQLEQGENPVYEMKPGPAWEPAMLFSKRFDHIDNPNRGFASIMVCSEADAGCPFVPGAEARFSLPFSDPKAGDGLSEEGAIYDERCRQMAVELFYAVGQAR